MEGTGDHDHMGSHEMSYTHMTFYWGKDSEILFRGWPATRDGMYALALIFVFFLGVIVEWLSHCSHAKFSSGSSPPSTHSSPPNRIMTGLVQTALYGLRVGLAFLLMLAVMSFNGGVLLVAVAGHAVGFFLFGSRAIRAKPEEKAVSSDPSPCGC
ncbi:hypothetical protein CDL15_Pgr024960 [Punica granatum]|nr:hypothetical protein CDL15_Pgr024960 [Punica granatum]PKI66493.1 hypothetical protein CRG98_013149 [Punica granatum]